MRMRNGEGKRGTGKEGEMRSLREREREIKVGQDSKEERVKKGKKLNMRREVMKYGKDNEVLELKEWVWEGERKKHREQGKISGGQKGGESKGRKLNM